MENKLHDDPVHCTGNGKICVYGRRADIIQLFGPPYSSPVCFSLKAPDTGCVSKRGQNTSVWTHTTEYGNMLDFTCAEKPVFIRSFELLGHTDFIITPAEKVLTQIAGDGSLILQVPAGTRIFAKVFSYTDSFTVVRVQNGVFERQNGHIVLHMRQGSGLLTVSPASFEQKIDALEELASVRAKGKNDYAKCVNAQNEIPDGFAGKEQLITLIDDTATLIQSQQAAEGAVLAGYNYHLGYVRDQYGVSRALLAIGLVEEARRILAFYRDVFARRGTIKNAQPAGFDGWFHVHENDASEITGYLIIQVFDYFDASGDADFLQTLLPLMNWAFDEQLNLLHGGMMPFNGDETYIAGGVLPRVCMEHGSAEATLLFIAGGERLAAITENKERKSRILSAVSEVRGLFGHNFIQNGVLYANNPLRDCDTLFKPALRHGVCEVCNSYYGYIALCGDRHYKCPVCADKPADAGKIKRYALNSVLMMPGYIGCDRDIKNITSAAVKAVSDNFCITGALPSRPDGDVTVGYDYGMLLYNMARYKTDDGGRLSKLTLDIADKTGAWSEYYQNNIPKGTRCRPWESGINLEGLINYAKTFK